MTLEEKHIERIERVNLAIDEVEHGIRRRELRAWRAGVEDAGGRLDLIGADLHYIDKGIDRPMVCGVWLDWEPAC
jgi:hypothetical protein